MPILDFSVANSAPSFPNSCDILIVGAGAAGLFLATKLSKNYRVIVVESGSTDISESHQSLNEVVNSAKPLTSAKDGRKRSVGGTTVAWGGQSLPFQDIDFEKRDWVPGSGWPIKIGDLSRHYEAANLAMGIDALDYREEVAKALRFAPPPFDSSVIDFHYSKWAPEPNFAKLFRRNIETDFVLLKNCHFLGVSVAQRKVESVRLAATDHRETTIHASHVIVAAGGLESTRICLLLDKYNRLFSEHQRSRLGRGFMEHPSVYAGWIAARNNWHFQRTFSTHLHRGRKYSKRMSASPDWQRANRTLNVTAGLMMKTTEQDFDPYTEFRDFTKLFSRTRYAGSFLSCALRTSWAYAAGRFIYKHGAVPHLCICAEQDPTNGSYLELTEGGDVDAFGAPRLNVHWNISLPTWRTIVLYSKAIRAEFDRLSLGTLHLRSELEDENQPRADILYDIAHHMGGTPMGPDYDHSIVDTDLRVRGLKNLWICSSSVFPTSSHSNPTLTVLALGNRLAEKLMFSGLSAASQ